MDFDFLKVGCDFQIVPIVTIFDQNCGGHVVMDSAEYWNFMREFSVRKFEAGVW